MILDAIKSGKDEQLSVTSHSIIGITTLEKIIEQILSMNILDEKDMDKKLRNPSGHFSITMHDESQNNVMEMTEMLNDRDHVWRDN